MVLWEHGDSPVRFVNEHLASGRKVGYTTTLKIMQIMTDKGMLGRKEEGRGHIYYPLIRKEEIQLSMLDRFLENTFSGSAKKLVMQVLGHYQPNQQELREIREMIEKLENDRS